MNNIYDVIIIGAGPAGVACAYMCKKKGLSYLLIENGKSVYQNIINTYPEGKNVYPSKPKNSAEFLLDELRPPDKPVTVEMYVQYVQHFVQHENLSVITETSFDNIEQRRDGFVVTTNKGNYESKKVILSFGNSIPKELKVYGDAKMVARTLDDPKKYVGLRTLIIGGGNTAADVVISILQAKREVNDHLPVYWAHLSGKFDVNTETAQRLGEEILLGGSIRLLPGAIPRIGEVDEEGVDRLVIRINQYQETDGIEIYHAMSFPMKNVIACIGSQSATPLLDKLQIQTISCTAGICKVAKEGDRLVMLTPEFETTRKGIYMIGGAISPSYLKISEGAIIEEKHPNLIYTAINDAVRVIDHIYEKIKVN